MSNIELLCDISELNHLFRDSANVENLMQQTVDMVASHMKVDVCSIYTYDEDDKILMLKATRGLTIRSVGNVCMKLSEGLTGKALKELRTIRVAKASSHPDYKYFADTDEEMFEVFMAVPILRGITRIGVLVLQRKNKNPFTENDELTCKAVASQLANIIENARFLMAMHVPAEHKAQPADREEIKFIKGKPASKGFAHAQARIVDKHKRFAELLKRDYEQSYGVEDFENAVIATAGQLEQLQNQVEEKLSDAASLIFASHLMILKDNEFVGTMKKLIAEGNNAPDAVLRIAKEYIDVFTASEDDYFREKVQDVEDLTVRLVANLIGHVEEMVDYNNCIVIARELFPSDLLRMSSESVRGIILVSGGVTSHLSILARSLQIPMVIANQTELMTIKEHADVLIDAEIGNVYIDPTDEIVARFDERNKSYELILAQKPHVKPATFTRDGTEISLMANINLLSDITNAQDPFCRGVGLYRTEFPFIIRNDFPSEQEQYITYKRLVEGMAPKPVTFRTLDIGGDKVLSYYHHAREQNPGMGMRSIRFSLQNKDVFGKQIRAILRAGAGADIRIMFPMISSLEEYLEARELVYLCSQELKGRDIEHNQSPQIGMMIEIPSVLNLIDAFAKVVDFFSIGTNDFIQFMLGVDRTNENVESFYIPHHPAVLRGIDSIAKSAVREGKDVSICGDMAHQGEYIPFLLATGIRILSVDPAYLPEIQQIIQEIDLNVAEQTAQKILAETSVAGIGKLLNIKSSG